MDAPTLRAVRFLEREIETYKALALFFARTESKKRVWTADGPLRPSYYVGRIREATQVLSELR